MKYWPINQSLELNIEVANLLVQTYKKFSYDLSNLTNTRIPIDFIDNHTKKQLFISVLIELEVLVLDLVELDLSIVNVMKLSVKLLYDLVDKSMQSFLLRSQCQLQYGYVSYTSVYMKFLFIENKFAMESLLKYLIFGSSAVKEMLYPFNNSKTPLNHVALLLDNMIIQISNAVIYSLLYNIKSLPEAVEFFVSNNLSNLSYISVRSLALLKNTLLSNAFVNWYFDYPKNIYSSRYKIWIICSLGLINKYIIVYRSEDSLKMEKLQLLIVLLIEVQDFFIPRIKASIVVFGRLFAYILLNTIFNSFKACIKIFIYILNQLKD